MRQKKWNTRVLCGFGAMVLVSSGSLVGCGKSDSAAGSGALTISGSLAGSTGALVRNDLSLSSRELNQALNLGLPEGTASLANLTSYGVRCVTLSGTPSAGEGTCDSTGKFSLSLADATGVPIGCFILKDASVVAVVAFQSSTTGMDGTSVREGSYVAGSGASGLEFGTISFNETTGQATVTKSNVIQSGGSAGTLAGTWADVTGNWVIAAAPSTPTGYATVCPAGTQNCQGPTAGEGVHLRQYKALDGSSQVHHGLSIWQSEAAFTACGSKEGVTLPAGWTAQAGDLTTAAQLTNAPSIVTTFPDPASVVPPGGSFCGQNNLTSCNAISASGWGLTADQCKLYCTFTGLWENQGSSCTGEFFVNWSTFYPQLSAASPAFSSGAWSGVTPTTSGNTVTYFGGTVKFEMKPKKRHMSSELVINGNVGTLMDSHSWNFTACTQFDANHNCTGSSVTCTVTENSRLTMTQLSATSADMELVMKTSLDPNANAACSTNDDVANRLGERKMFFRANKS